MAGSSEYAPKSVAAGAEVVLYESFGWANRWMSIDVNSTQSGLEIRIYFSNDSGASWYLSRIYTGSGTNLYAEVLPPSNVRVSAKNTSASAATINYHINSHGQ